MDQEAASEMPIPMDKEETIKEDGRLLIYYTFPPEQPADDLSLSGNEKHV